MDPTTIIPTTDPMTRNAFCNYWLLSGVSLFLRRSHVVYTVSSNRKLIHFEKKLYYRTQFWGFHLYSMPSMRSNSIGNLCPFCNSLIWVKFHGDRLVSRQIQLYLLKMVASWINFLLLENHPASRDSNNIFRHAKPQWPGGGWQWEITYMYHPRGKNTSVWPPRLTVDCFVRK